MKVRWCQPSLWHLLLELCRGIWVWDLVLASKPVAAQPGPFQRDG